MNAKFLVLNETKIKKAINKIEKLDLSKTTVKRIEGIIKPLFEGYIISAPKYSAPFHIYRGRICTKPNYLKEVTYPRKSIVKNFGRLNYINESIFYGASTKNIILFELNAELNDNFIFTKWRTTKDIILNHIGFSSETTKKLDSNRRLDSIYDFVKDTHNFNTLNTLVYNYLAEQFTHRIYPGEEFKYKLSIAIGRKLMMGNQMDGVLYPSIGMKGNADNIALRPSFVDSYLEFENISFGNVEKEDSSYKIVTLDTATTLEPETGKILWSGRNFNWTLKQKDQFLFFRVENGEWVAYDQNNKKVNPE